MIDRRTKALDALDSVLPFDRRDFLAGLLTDDVATLRHLAREDIRSPAISAQNDPSVAVNGHRHAKSRCPSVRRGTCSAGPGAARIEACCGANAVPIAHPDHMFGLANKW